MLDANEVATGRDLLYPLDGAAGVWSSGTSGDRAPTYESARPTR